LPELERERLTNPPELNPSLRTSPSSSLQKAHTRAIFRPPAALALALLVPPHPDWLSLIERLLHALSHNRVLSDRTRRRLQFPSKPNWDHRTAAAPAVRSSTSVLMCLRWQPFLTTRGDVVGIVDSSNHHPHLAAHGTLLDVLANLADRARTRLGGNGPGMEVLLGRYRAAGPSASPGSINIRLDRAGPTSELVCRAESGLLAKIRCKSMKIQCLRIQ
jgi:hypothetical protein